jgi:putative ABC transport system permease protein
MALWSDVRFAARTLVREPGFAALCVVMLALGIGANTAIFSIVNGILLRPLPYHAPDRLVGLREIIPAVASTYPTLPVSARHFTEWRQRCSSFASLSAMGSGTANLTGAGEPEQLQIAHISANLFETLGVQPSLGRRFIAGEDSEGHDRVAVIAESLWRRRFREDPAIVGKTIMLDSAAHSIVGVLPARFRFPGSSILDTGSIAPEKPEVFKPIVFSKDELKELMGTFNYNVIGRLKDGVSSIAALAELNVIAAQLEKLAGQKVDLRASVTPIEDNIVGRSRRGLVILLGAVGSVLLIVCVNLANLMLARAERRGHEWAIRTALGASPARLVRQVFAETLLIAFAGGILGVAIAAGSLNTLLQHAPRDIPRLDEVRLDTGVLLFALAITAATGLLFGLAPAWRSTRSDPQTTLRSGGRTSTAARQGARFRGVLVSAEVGLSTVLLILAALLAGSFMRVLHSEKGFRAPTVLSANIAIPRAKYSEDDQRNRFHEQVLDRLASQPGVVSASICTALPLTGETWVDAAWAPGDTRPEMERPLANVRFVSADYLKTMGIPLLAGRTFNENDRKRKVAILSERLARQIWPGQNAVGRQFTRGDGSMNEVIGVAGDVKADPDKPPVAMIYRPYWDWAPRRVTLVVRAAGDPRSVAGAMRTVIRSVDPDLPVPEMRTMQEILEESVAVRRFQTLLSAAFGVTALLLAALGIYGVVSYAVARRTNEMGVRMALGARPWDLHFMIIAQAMSPVAIGLILGFAAAFAAGRVVSSLLYEVSARDPWTILSVMALLATVAAGSCWLPARRAAKLNPLDALRYE